MKIPLVLVTFQEVDIVKSCINSLIPLSNIFDIYVLENHSENSSILKEYNLDLLSKKLICKYILFDKNITNNMLRIVFANKLINLDSRYIIISDGDVTPLSNSWWEEEKNILDKNPEVLCCGINLDLTNLPLKTIPDCKKWFCPVQYERPDYTAVYTGVHLLAFRMQEFKKMNFEIGRNKLPPKDASVKTYCIDNKRIWARTKKSSAIHLTWNLYHDLNHPYTKLKMSGKNLWNHNEKCGFKEFK